MRIIEYISEITKPVGAIYLRFKVRMGDVPPNASREEKRKSLYLTAFTGFANDPKELTAANARLRFMKLNSMNDIVKMIKEIMGDKTFISAKSMTIYMDLPDSAFNTFPYLKEFMGWVGKNGGDRIKVEWKPEGEGEEDPLKKKRKPNPNKDIKQVDYDPADPRYTIHFTVSDRFYDAIRKSMPNLMQYKGSGQDFRMPKELFDKFRDAAKQRYGDIGLKILKKAHTDESIEEGRAPRLMLHPKVVEVLKRNGFQGPFELKSLPNEWMQSLKDIHGADETSQVMISGNDVENDEWVMKVDNLGHGTYAYGQEDGYQIGKAEAAIRGFDESLEEGADKREKDNAIRNFSQDGKDTQKQNIKQQFGQKAANKAMKKRVSFLSKQTNKGLEEDITDEGGPASRSLCLSKKSNSQLGASQLASCKSQGLRAREGEKSHKFKDGKRVKVGGHKIKGKAHGGPLPDWGTRGAKKK